MIFEDKIHFLDSLPMFLQLFLTLYPLVIDVFSLTFSSRWLPYETGTPALVH